MATTYNAGETPEVTARVAETAGMSDAEFDRWVEQQGGQPVSRELWEKLAKSGIFPELPPRGTKTYAA
jgi:hypothetical protein